MQELSSMTQRKSGGSNAPAEPPDSKPTAPGRRNSDPSPTCSSSSGPCPDFPSRCSGRAPRQHPPAECGSKASENDEHPGSSSTVVTCGISYQNEPTDNYASNVLIEDEEYTVYEYSGSSSPAIRYQNEPTDNYTRNSLIKASIYAEQDFQQERLSRTFLATLWADAEAHNTVNPPTSAAGSGTSPTRVNTKEDSSTARPGQQINHNAWPTEHRIPS